MYVLGVRPTRTHSLCDAGFPIPEIMTAQLTPLEGEDMKMEI